MTSDVIMGMGPSPISQRRGKVKKPANVVIQSFLKSMSSKKNLCALSAILLALLIVSFAIVVKDTPKAQPKSFVEAK